MAEQWLRRCKLKVQKKQGGEEALDLSDFKIYAHISQATVDAPKAAEIYIYNLSTNTMNALAGADNENLGATVTLEVGYQSTPLELLFKGQVFQYRRGRDNEVDTWLCILCQSGDHLKTHAVINQCVPAGTTIDEAGKVLVAETAKHDIEQGEIPQLSDQAYPRGRVFFGGLYTHLEQFYNENNVFLDVDDGILGANTYVGYRTEPMIVLNRKSGMIGMPQLTMEGLEVTCLLNPKLKRGQRVQVDMTNMQTEAYDIAYGQQGVDQPSKNPNLATNAGGIFIIQSIESTLDNRGNDWYSKLICTAIGATVPKSGISITAVD